jgi:hypothetical protein
VFSLKKKPIRTGRAQHRARAGVIDDDVFYLFLQKQKSAQRYAFAEDSFMPLFAQPWRSVLVGDSVINTHSEIRQRLGEDAKLGSIMTKIKFYIPGVSRAQVRELVLRDVEQDPSNKTPRLRVSMNSMTRILLNPILALIITVTGLKCVGMPIGTPEFVNALQRAIQGPCHRAACSKASHCHGPKDSI